MPTSKLGRSYSMSEWGDLRGISRQTIYRLIQQDRIRTYKIGRRRYITEAADREFIERMQREASPVRESL